LNTSSSHLPTKFSQPPNLHICITSSQFSLLAALAVHLWSHSLAHPHYLLFSLFPSGMLPLVSGINSRLPSVNHALILPSPPNPILWVALPPSFPSTHHSHHPSPLHSFTPGLNFPFLQIFPTIAYLFFSWTDSTDSPDYLSILLNISVFTL